MPAGTYQRELRQFGHIQQNMVIPGSYQEFPKNLSLKGVVLVDKVDGKATPVSILGLFTSMPKGMNQAGSLIFFVFFIVAVFNIIQHTGMVNVVMHYLMHAFRNSCIWLFLIVYITLFSDLAEAFKLHSPKKK